MQWKECTKREALAHGKVREMSDVQTIKDVPNIMDVQEFTDGTAIGVQSQWSGPYSEVTPDIDGEPPQWWIYS